MYFGTQRVVSRESVAWECVSDAFYISRPTVFLRNFQNHDLFTRL